MPVMDQFSKNKMNIALTVHTEKLHSDNCWRRVLKICEKVELMKGRMTFFCIQPNVYPYDFPEKVWSERIRELQERGHEIQVHTHFYHKDHDEYDLSYPYMYSRISDNVDYLKSLGSQANKFISGTWRVSADLYKVLKDLKFIADFSARREIKGYLKGRAHTLTMESPCSLSFPGASSLLLVPSCGSLGDYFKALILGRRKSLFFPRLDQKVLVLGLHDYDLLRGKYYNLLRFLLRGHFGRHALFWTVQEMIDVLQERVETTTIEENALKIS